MKLTGELKDKVDAVETTEEKKDIIAQAGMELTDDELESVAGGSAFMHPESYRPKNNNQHDIFIFLEFLKAGSRA